jgi:hypothetical protein
LLSAKKRRKPRRNRHFQQIKLQVQAADAYNAGMQYTLRNIPKNIDTAVRQKAKRQGRSLNDAAIEALANWAGVGVEVQKKRDLSDIAGTWVEDPEFDKAIEEMRRIDPELWR